jgi:hypothetical protein
MDMFQDRFNQSYEQYLILRGYDPSSGKLIVLKRALIDSWGEPGFHQFWRVWNPGVGHVLYRLYLSLGGNRIRPIATMLVFTLCGFMHDVLVMLIFRRPFAAFTAAFTFCGILTVISRSLEPILDQERWPRLLNVFTNVSFLAASIYSAVHLQMLIFP